MWKGLLLAAAGLAAGFAIAAWLAPSGSSSDVSAVPARSAEALRGNRLPMAVFTVLIQLPPARHLARSSPPLTNRPGRAYLSLAAGHLPFRPRGTRRTIVIFEFEISAPPESIPANRLDGNSFGVGGRPSARNP